MTFRTAISAIALVSALFLPGVAAAQTDRADIQRACAAARSAANQSLSEPVENETDTTATGSSSSESDDPDPAARDNTDTLAGSLTAAQCRQAGY